MYPRSQVHAVISVVLSPVARMSAYLEQFLTHLLSEALQVNPSSHRHSLTLRGFVWLAYFTNYLVHFLTQTLSSGLHMNPVTQRQAPTAFKSTDAAFGSTVLAQFRLQVLVVVL